MKKNQKTLVLFLLCWTGVLFGQSRDAKFDAPATSLSASPSARQQAERLMKILTIKNSLNNYDFSDNIRQLDSLYHCCLAGKKGDERFMKQIEATASYFKASSLIFDYPNLAKPLLQRAANGYAELGDVSGEAFSYVDLCNVANGIGDTLLLADSYDQALRIIPLVKDPEILAALYCSLGATSSDAGRYLNATANYFEAFRLIDKNKTAFLLELEPAVCYNLSQAYVRIGDYENALVYALKTVAHSESRPTEAFEAYYQLGSVYILKKDYRQALKALEKSKEFPIMKSKEQVLLGISYCSFATCYRNLGEIEKALTLAQKAVELIPMEGSSSWGGEAMNELSACELVNGMTEKALCHALMAYHFFLQINNSYGIVTISELLIKIYKAKGDYRQAFKFSELRYQFQQKIELQQSTRQLALGEFTRKAEVEKAKREAEVKFELDQQRNIRYALYGGLGVLALLASLLYNRFRYKQRTATQLEAKNREVEAARLRAEKSEAFKSRFLANMSHEIRTPLHGIAGFADLLLDTSLSEKQRRWLSSIHHSTDRLGEVVNDILDLSKLEAGEVKLRQIAFSPAQLARDVQDALQLRAENKGIQLQLQIGENVPPAVLGDPTRLYQILMNLAGNAVKFTERGKVELSVASEGATSSHPLASLRFAVSDTGIGIPPEKLASIFESFRQAEDDTTARFGGTGLGLSIARELVQLHGSDIQVESELGKGSTFSFDLALPLADAADMEKVAQTQGDLFFTQKLTILLADDNEFNREIAAEAIRRHFEHAEIVEAANGREVIALLNSGGDLKSPPEFDFDLILMDMQMPEMTGAEATRHIREELLSGIPIIALTASATPEEIEAALESGMNRHLGKPFKPGELAQAIAETLQLSSDGPFRKFQTFGKVDPEGIGIEKLEESPNQAFDLRFLRDFCGGDEVQVHHFIQKFLAQYPLEVARLEAAFRQEDRNAIYQAAHSFRPQLEFVGLKKAAELASQLELGTQEGLSFSKLSALFEQIVLHLDIEYPTQG